MAAYYNEFDKFAAAWLRRLIQRGLIAPGEVDERDIRDVCPADLRGFTQCHFFAGIGGWSHALRLAGWDDDRPVWTGSCPCQPFSAAGRRTGLADERHLWPAFFWLINQCRPHTVFGEQVSSKDGLQWFDAVSTDLERADYTVGALDIGAASVGAPHIRQRLFFVADTERDGCGRSGPGAAGAAPGGVQGTDRKWERLRADARPVSPPLPARLADSGSDGCSPECLQERREAQEGRPGSPVAQHGIADGFWADAKRLSCRDGKYRAVKPGIFPLANGFPGRVGLLRGAGNAIVPPLAAEFIGSYMDLYNA